MERVFSTLSEAYARVLSDLLHCPTYVSSPRGQAVREILGYKFTVTEPDSAPIVTKDPARNAVIAEYTAKEFELYYSGTRSAADYAKAASFWSSIANPDGTINSAYGHLVFHRQICGNPAFNPTMVSPWNWAIETLKQDRDSRQAVISFNTPDVFWRGNKDVVCTLSAHLFIRGGCLHMLVNMRSNDAVLGLVYDAPWFISLMQRALQELRTVYPEIQIGRYTHYANSMHVYERNVKIAQQMLGDITCDSQQS